MKAYLSILCLFSGCALGQASGPFCGGDEARIWAVGVLQKPELIITCPKGGGLEFNNSNQLSELMKLLQLVEKVK
jgi:hypothetical protein